MTWSNGSASRGRAGYPRSVVEGSGWRLSDFEDYTKLTMRIANIDRSYLLRTLAVAVLAVVLSTALHASGKLAPVETILLDVYSKTFPIQPQNTIVVALTNEDYRSLFDRKSPLKPELLQRLLDKIGSGHPALVIVDIDTTDPSF